MQSLMTLLLGSNSISSLSRTAPLTTSVRPRRTYLHLLVLFVLRRFGFCVAVAFVVGDDDAVNVTPHRIAASSISMFISSRVLNLMQYPVTLALPSSFPYVWAKYFLSSIPRI